MKLFRKILDPKSKGNNKKYIVELLLETDDLGKLYKHKAQYDRIADYEVAPKPFIVP